MPLPSFEKSLDTFSEPGRSVVQAMAERWEDFNNVVIRGNYPSDEDEKVTMNAWIIVSLVPKSLNPSCTFLECHLTAGSEHDEARWLAHIREVISGFSAPSQLARLHPDIVGGLIHSKLGKDKIQIVGMISLHRVIKSNQEFTVLWTHPELSQEAAEHMMKIVLTNLLQ